MARFDRESGEIVLRIVYDGPATAGKSTTLRALRTAFESRARGEIIVPEESSSGRTLYFDWLELKVGHVDDVPARAEILSVPGQLSYADRRLRVLRTADAAVFVCASTPAGCSAGRIAWKLLVMASEGAPPLPTVLVANKQDLDGALDPEEVARRVGCDPRMATGASAIEADGARGALVRALDLARSRVRAELAGAPATALPPAGGGAARLYASLKEERAPEAGFYPALDMAIEELSRDPSARGSEPQRED